MLVSARPLLCVSLSASIEAACQSQHVVRTAFQAVSFVAHLLRNVCLSASDVRLYLCLRVDSTTLGETEIGTSESPKWTFGGLKIGQNRVRIVQECQEAAQERPEG